MKLSKIMKNEVTICSSMGMLFVALFTGLVYITVIVVVHASGKYETVRTIYPADNIECVIVSRGARSDIDCWPIEGVRNGKN